jgi:hypothetical protein
MIFMKLRQRYFFKRILKTNGDAQRKVKNNYEWSSIVTGLQINLYLEQSREIQLFATFFQRRK